MSQGALLCLATGGVSPINHGFWSAAWGRGHVAKVEGGLKNHPMGDQVSGRGQMIDAGLARLRFCTVEGQTKRTKLHIDRCIQRTIISTRIAPQLGERSTSAVHGLTNRTGGVGRLTRQTGTKKFTLMTIRLIGLGGEVIRVVGRLSSS